MREMWGYAFTCPLSLRDMHRRLTELESWPWREWWKDRLRLYIWGAVMDAPDLGTIWIVEDRTRGGYGISAKLESNAPDWKERFERVRTRMLDELLPAMGGVLGEESDEYYG